MTELGDYQNAFRKTQPGGKRVVNRISALSIALLTSGLLKGEMDCKELAEFSGLSYVSVLRYTRALHNVRPKAAYIHHWNVDERGLASIKVYKIGLSKSDAPRPCKSHKEISQAYRDRKKARAAHLQSALIGASI